MTMWVQTSVVVVLCAQIHADPCLLVPNCIFKLANWNIQTKFPLAVVACMIGMPKLAVFTRLYQKETVNVEVELNV